MYKYTFDEYVSDVDAIAIQVEASGIAYDHIVGIARGGLIPAVQLSHQLKVPFASIHWSTRDNIGRDLKNILLLAGGNKRILLVDDICDSGKTLTEITTYPFFKAKIDTAVLIYNVAQEFTPTYFGKTIDRTKFTDWLDFWWETI